MVITQIFFFFLSVKMYGIGNTGKMFTVLRFGSGNWNQRSSVLEPSIDLEISGNRRKWYTFIVSP